MLNGSIEEMLLHHQLIETRVSDECGCPEEDWIIGAMYTTIHMEPVSGGHILIDCGDWEDEKLVECENMDQLRLKAVEWINSIPYYDD